VRKIVSGVFVAFLFLAFAGTPGGAAEAAENNAPAKASEIAKKKPDGKVAEAAKKDSKAKTDAAKKDPKIKTAEAKKDPKAKATDAAKKLKAKSAEAKKKALAKTITAFKKMKPEIKPALVGIASVYKYNKLSRSASGEIINFKSMIAAHRTFRFGTQVRVTNRRNGKSVVVRIIDRGPFIRGRVIDLSPAAARQIGLGWGLAPVTLAVMGAKA
jgi:rare lipoprotein A